MLSVETKEIMKNNTLVGADTHVELNGSTYVVSMDMEGNLLLKTSVAKSATLVGRKIRQSIKRLELPETISGRVSNKSKKKKTGRKPVNVSKSVSEFRYTLKTAKVIFWSWIELCGWTPKEGKDICIGSCPQLLVSNPKKFLEEKPERVKLQKFTLEEIASKVEGLALSDKDKAKILKAFE